MKFLHHLWSLLSVICLSLATSDGLTNAVTWDNYSLLVNGERVFIFSGEFHYERLPVPALWRDVMEKYKANGLNAISIYFFWSYHSASKGVFDFTSPGKDIQYLMDTAKEVGLYVIARPGPFCNAEANAGGLALWGSDGSLGVVRTADETYHQAWLPWIQAVGSILAKNQISNGGGNLIMWQIENELTETVHSAGNTIVQYVEQVEKASRAAGITVPFSSNEKGERGQSWSTDYENVGGAVNLYGLDSYPGGLGCGTNLDAGFKVIRNYYQWFQSYSFTQPEALPEFEAGYFQPWGGYFYDQCLAEHAPEFADVFYKNNIGQRVTVQNLYMAFGGTNYGNIGAPVVYTSYDYSAPLRETREVQLKFKQTKLVGLFTRVSLDLLKTKMESNGTGNAVSSAAVFSWVLRNPDNRAGFYVLQQANTASRASVDFSAYLSTTAGTVTVPNVQLNGRQSKIVTTDYHFGNDALLYCSADILTYGIFDYPVLVLYLESGQIGEFAFSGGANGLSFKVYGSAKFLASSATTKGTSYTKYTYTQTAGSTVVRFSNGLLVYLLDTQTAWNFFAPSTSSDPHVKPTSQVFVLGPYNVRSVSIAGSQISLIGDNANTANLEVYAGARYDTISWNGKALSTKRTSYGSLVATAPGAEGRNIALPTLSWVVADSLPEINRDYDDSKWTVCAKTTSLSPVKPLTLPVLFSSDYGFYAGSKIYRGHFDGTTATSVDLTVQGGLAAGWSAWLNGQFVGGNQGKASLSATSAVLNLANAVKYSKGNVLTVVTDYTGHDEGSLRNPRGILGAQLYAGNQAMSFTQWKIQGNAGGSANIDPVRGPLNEDGLHGTRLGWQLPGFDASGWSAGSPLQGLKRSGISWYTTKFTLALDTDLDVPLGIELDSPSGTIASVQIFVNGYQYGKYIPQIGPQTRFPIPPGVINNQGENVISISLWAQTDAGARLTTASLFSYGKYQSGFDFSQIGKSLQPGWSKNRLQYA